MAGTKHVSLRTSKVLTNRLLRQLDRHGNTWKKVDDNLYEIRDRKTDKGEMDSARDLVFGSNSILRSYAEVYAHRTTAKKSLSMIL